MLLKLLSSYYYFLHELFCAKTGLEDCRFGCISPLVSVGKVWFTVQSITQYAYANSVMDLGNSLSQVFIPPQDGSHTVFCFWVMSDHFFTNIWQYDTMFILANRNFRKLVYNSFNVSLVAIIVVGLRPVKFPTWSLFLLLGFFYA